MTLVPLHPEATSDPQMVRWIIPAGTLPVVGRIAEPPDDLFELVRCGDIASIEVETRAVVIALAPGRSWSALGSRVRDALSASLQQPERWRAVRTVTDDDLLVAAMQDVLAGSAGDYIRSHGGEVSIVSAKDGRAEIAMTGACEHCPAAGLTLHARLEHELRSRFPQLVELRAVGECRPVTGPLRFLGQPRKR